MEQKRLLKEKESDSSDNDSNYDDALFIAGATLILGLGIGGFGIYGHFRKGGRTKVRKSSKCGSYKETPAGIRLADYTSFESILTSGDHFPPDYDANTAKWTSSLMSYLGCDVRAENAEFDRIVEWFAGFSSVHQCSLGALKSIGEMGAVASLNLLSNAWRNVDELARLVWLRPGPSDFAATTLYSPGKQDQLNAAKGFVRAYCRIVQGERSPKIVKDLTNKVLMGVPIETLSFGIGVFRGVPELTPADQSAFSSAESDANSTGLNTSDMKKWVEDVTNILSSTLESVQPISFDVDKKIGTDKTVFAIHGPNMGNYGGAEVAIVFKNMALRHPDAFLTPVAAMGYYQGWYVKNSRVGTDRPWIGNAKPWQSGGQEDYLSSIFQVSTQYWAEACAMEWIARVVQQGRTGSGPRREPRDVSLADVQEMWRNADPHTAIEAHLPGFIPLSLVDRVFVCSSAPGAAEVCESLRAMKIQCVAVADTKTAVWNYMAAPAGNRSSNMHTEGKGCYDFFVEGGCGGKECTVPVDIVEAGVRSVSFEAVNGGMTTDLMVTISDTPSAARAPGKGHCVTFRLPPFDTNVYAYELPPGDVVGKGKTQPLTSGSFGAPATVSRYTISVGDGVLVLMNDKTKKPAEVKFQRQMCRFVSFSAETYPLLIKDCYLN